MSSVTKHENKRSSGCMKKQAISNPVLISGLAGASVGGFGGNLAADLFWRKPTKTQRILSILLGAGLGGVVTGGVVNALNKDPGQKPAVTKALNAGKDVVAQSGNSLGGNLPDDKGWGNLTPWGKAAYGDSSVGGLAGAYGWLVNKAKRSLPDLGDKEEGGTTAEAAASLGASALGATGGWKAVGALATGNNRRVALISTLDKLLNNPGSVQDPGSFLSRNPTANLKAIHNLRSQLTHGFLFSKDFGRLFSHRTGDKLKDIIRALKINYRTRQGKKDTLEIINAIRRGAPIPLDLTSRKHSNPRFTSSGAVPFKTRYRWTGHPENLVSSMLRNNLGITNSKDLQAITKNIANASRGGKGTLALKILGALAGQTAAGTAAENWLGHNTKYDTRLNQLRAAYSDTLGK